MSPIYQQIGLIVIGNAISVLTTMYLIRWKKRENRPRELEIEIDRLGKNMIALRGQIKYLEGRMNGTAWKQGGLSGK